MSRSAKDAILVFYAGDNVANVSGAQSLKVVWGETNLLAQHAPQLELSYSDAEGSLYGGLGESRVDRSYTPYGYERSSQSGPIRYGFKGYWSDFRSGKCVLGKGYRLFSSMLMRFTSPDRFSPFDRGGVNAYAYCQ